MDKRIIDLYFDNDVTEETFEQWFICGKNMLEDEDVSMSKAFLKWAVRNQDYFIDTPKETKQ